MTIAELDEPPPLSPAAEALLACERDIQERTEIVRARILARARDSFHVANGVSVDSRRWKLQPLRIVIAGAAGVALMVSAAAAFQVMARTVSPQPSSAPASIAHAIPEPKRPTGPAAVSLETMIAEPPSAQRPSTIRKEEIEELHLLHRARQADSHGDYLSALAIVNDHERRYAYGRLAEERDVLRVKALVGLGRTADARHFVAKFHKKFPHSVLLKKVDAMLSSMR